MWTQEVKKRAINSIYYRKGGKAVALISEGTLIDVQAYPAQQHLMKGEGGAGIQPTLHFPKPCTLAWGCVFLTKALHRLVDPCWKFTTEDVKSYCCITVYPLDNCKLSHQVFQFHALLLHYPLLLPNHPLQILFPTHAVHIDHNAQTYTVKEFNLTFYVCMRAMSLQSCPTLYDSVDCNPPGFSVCGILQARILEWVAMPSSGGSS